MGTTCGLQIPGKLEVRWQILKIFYIDHITNEQINLMTHNIIDNIYLAVFMLFNINILNY